MGKGKVKQPGSASKTSGGKRQSSLAKKALLRVVMKINRWKKYKEVGKVPSKQSKRTGWDISGLEKHASFLKSLIK